MKQLTLVRHAKSDWGDPDLRDFDRPLNRRGEKNAPHMGARLRQRGVLPESIIVSSARRARETARLLLPQLSEQEIEPVIEERLYLATTSELLQTIRDLEDAWQSVMLIGHNPDMTELANLLGDLRIANLPTCGVVCFELDVRSWSDVAPGCAHSWVYDYPKNLDPPGP